MKRSHSKRPGLREIRDHRKQLGYTQGELAEMCDVGTMFVSQLENGKPTAQLDRIGINEHGRINMFAREKVDHAHEGVGRYLASATSSEPWTIPGREEQFSYAESYLKTAARLSVCCRFGKSPFEAANRVFFRNLLRKEAHSPLWRKRWR
ncbi:MAG: helix-turn-helix domain-containing protein [Adlercreutzia sp.]